MAISFVVISMLLAASQVNANSLDDFSNNLATDLGPLVALFGENITRQYISESTSFLDYLIFSMAPMGIVTAITSVIRVCGDSSLRAFIGRAQEGDGAIEAELCTSTSRDVCELFHKGGITRVFGKPQILEIIRICEAGSEAGSKEKKLYLFREHLKSLPKGGEWVAESDKPPLLTRVMRRLLSAQSPPDSSAPPAAPLSGSNLDIEGRAGPNQHGQPDPPALASTPMVQNPNLSLNVGIEKLPNWAFVLVAVAGLFLQIGVVAMAGILTWGLEWSKDGAPDSLVGIQAAFSGDKSPLVFMIGTALLCIGMFWCAALVGEITDERSYRRQDKWELGPRSQLFWLQPGGQEISGETFDAFAYFEGERMIKGYTTSTKNKAEKFHVYTWVAVVVTIGGYVAQFIGLRGMNASVSIAQLGITLLMSFLRGCLRMRRLDQNDNKLTNMPDMVAGHELDWLTFELADEDLKEDMKKHDSHDGHDSHDYLWVITSQPHGTEPEKDTQKRHLGETLIRFRTELAHLTGHNSPTSQKEQESIQNWSDKQVAVRLAARRVARAVSDAADEILGRSPAQSHRDLNIGNLVLCSSSSICRRGGPLCVKLDPPSETATGGWTVSSARLEGILGLWLWSLKKAEHFQEEDEHSNKRSTAEYLPIARIFPSFGDDDQVGSLEFMQGELDLWLGPAVVKLQQGTLHRDSDTAVYNSLTAWRKYEGDIWRPGDWKTRGVNSVANKEWKRYFGLQPKPNQATNDKSSGAINERKGQQFLYTSTEDTLLSVCSRELYSVLLASLVRLDPKSAFSEVTITQTSGVPRLEHHKVEAIVASFTHHELGSRSDAILSIIPGIRNLLSPKTDDLFASLTRLAQRSSDGINGNVAEILFQWVYRHSIRKKESSVPRLMEANNLGSGLIALGEIYRSALASTSDDQRKQGYERVQQLIANYKKAGEQEIENIGEILDRYRDIAVQIARDHNEMEHVRALAGTPWAASDVPGYAELVSLIKNGQRTKSIYLLCKITSAQLTSELEGALASAAERNWPEVTMALLRLGALIDGQDDNGRTALSYWSEYGVKSMVSTFLDRGAFPDLPDMNRRTPLWWAARRSDREVIELLRSTGKVEIDSVDQDGRSPFSQAAEHGNREVVRMLRDTGLVMLDRKDHSGRTPLSYAAEKGALPIVEELVSDSRQVDPDAQDSDGRTPLSWAVGSGKAEVTAVLLRKFAARTDVADAEKRTPLFWAVQGRQPMVLSELLANVEPRAEKEVNARDLYGQTPLVWAAQHGHNDMIEKLRRSPGLDIDAVDDMGRTAIWWALRNGRVDTARAIPGDEAALRSRAAKTDAAGRSPLWWAARDGNESLVEQLLGLDADADAADSAGHTPLLWAARNGHEAVVHRLLESGRAQADVPDAMGRTPLSWAARFGHDLVVSMLLRTGSVHPDSRDDDGRTPLSWAAGGGHVKSVEALVACRASVDTKDFDGQTPWGWARANGHKVAMGCLAPPGANIE